MTDHPTGTATSSALDEPTYLIHNYEHRAYPLDGERPFTIGRDSRCDIMVSEVAVSRQHAELRPEGGTYVLHPLGSTPTFLNDVAIATPQTLRSGDVITIGTMRFVFVRGALPVAITIAPLQPRQLGINDYVSDRRPTLTYPTLLVPERARSSPTSPWRWIILIIAVIVIVYAVIQFAFQ